MDGLATRPALWTKVPRGYGRCDYQRFDNISSSHRVGYGTIGNVAVDCRFLFTKSQWGLIGDNQNPAGIVYLDLDFDQPADTRLRSATVLVTLKGDERQERRGQYSSAVTTHDNRSLCPVKFTDHYGPKHFHGRERSMRTSRETHITPNVNILGYGAGGVGLTTKKDSNSTTRWKFTGHLDATKGSIWYNRLRWSLEENELESQSLHSNILHTAFAFEHNASEFYMTVEVRGKLVGLKDRLKNTMMKFGGGDGRDRETVTTKFQWATGYYCPKRLDKVAEELPYDMERKNLYEIPFEMPDALPAQCQAMAGPTNSISGGFPDSEERLQPGLPEVPHIAQGMHEVPTLDELARAAGFAPNPESASQRQKTTVYQASDISSNKVVGSVREDSSVSDFEPKPKRKGVESKPGSHGDVVQPDVEIFLWLTGIPLIVMVLKLFATVMGLREDESDDGAMTYTDSNVKEGSMAHSQVGSHDNVAGRMNAQATSSPSSSLNGKSHFFSRRKSSLRARLGRIEEVHPEAPLVREAQEDYLLRVPA